MNVQDFFNHLDRFPLITGAFMITCLVVALVSYSIGRHVGYREHEQKINQWYSSKFGRHGSN